MRRIQLSLWNDVRHKYIWHLVSFEVNDQGQSLTNELGRTTNYRYHGSVNIEKGNGVCLGLVDLYHLREPVEEAEKTYRDQLYKQCQEVRDYVHVNRSRTDMDVLEVGKFLVNLLCEKNEIKGLTERAKLKTVTKEDWGFKWMWEIGA